MCCPFLFHYVVCKCCGELSGLIQAEAVWWLCDHSEHYQIECIIHKVFADHDICTISTKQLSNRQPVRSK